MGAVSIDLYLKSERYRYGRGNRAVKKRINPMVIIEKQ